MNSEYDIWEPPCNDDALPEPDYNHPEWKEGFHDALEGRPMTFDPSIHYCDGYEAGTDIATSEGVEPLTYQERVDLYGDERP